MKEATIRTRKRAAARRAPKSEGDVSGLLLLASAIGHVVQASSNASLRAEQRRIEAILREWQKAYDDLTLRYRDLRGAYERLSKQLENSERERRHLTVERVKLEDARVKGSDPKVPVSKPATRTEGPTS